MNSIWIQPLKTLQNRFANEAELQDAVASVLHHFLGMEHYSREHSLDKANRIDFLVTEGGKKIGIECKVKPNGMAVWRQLARYADHLDGLILITTAPVSTVLAPQKSDGTALDFTLIELWKNL